MEALTTEVESLLRNLPLFADIAHADLHAVARESLRMRVARGDLVFSRGAPCTGFHVVLEGQLKLFFHTPDGAEKVVEIIGPGDSFDKALIFIEQPYMVSAQALIDSDVLRIGKAAVLDALERNPAFARKMLTGLSRRVHGLVSDVEAYSLSTGTQRVVNYLLRSDGLIEGDHIRLQVSKRVLASRLSLTPEHFSRILHDLADKKMVRVEGRNITILDAARMRVYDGR